MRVLVFAAALVLFTAPAFAFHCPKDMAEIDAALAANPQVSAEQLAEVKKLRAEGEEQHNTGKHQDSVDTLAKAKEILGLK